MVRRAGSFAVALLALVALAGCVGIPSSGGVHDGDIIDEQANPEFVVLPYDPTVGSTQQEILEGFMQAVLSPQNGYGIAQKYLTTELQQTWKPDDNTIIRTGEVDIEPQGTNALTYNFSTKAKVDNEGRYTELRDAAPQSLSFGFAQENGEWRISQAKDGIVLSQSSFLGAFREQALYFFDPSNQYLVPDVRWFPSRAKSSFVLVQALLLGPSPWLVQAVNTAFPEATAVGEGSVTVASGTATVDLSSEALNSNPVQRDRMRQQLAATLRTQNIQLTVSGRPVSTPDDAGDRALVDPGVDSSLLIGAPGAFGSSAGTGVAPLPGLSDAVLAVGATAADLSADKQSIAMRGGDGAVYAASIGDSAPIVIDDRGGLAAPSIDPFRFVWSAQTGSAASLTTFDLDGKQHSVASGLPADASVVSLDVSRDGTRLLLYLSTSAGPQLSVYGIIRDKNVPVRLGTPLELAVGAQSPVDATWVNERTVATIGAGGEVTTFELGGPSASLGTVAGATTIVGGNGGTDGLRVLATAGQVWRPQGSGWANTGIVASFLATRQ